MINLGIIGIGKIAQDYIRLICNDAVSGARITALCSRNGTHLKQIQSQYPILSSAACFTDYDELLSSGLVDAVVICTPHGLHPIMTLHAIQSDVHVLVEKPVGISICEVEQALEELTNHSELVCGVLYNRRFSPAFQHIKGLVEKGMIGDLVRISWIITDLYRTEAYYRTGSWRGTWETEGGGVLMTQASHQLDLMQWICGMPSTVLARCSSVGRPILTENEAELLFTFSNGAHGHFIASAHECPGSNYLEICGTRGRILVQNDSEVELAWLSEDELLFAKNCPLPFEKVPYSKQTLTFDGKDNYVQQAATIQNFVEAIEGRASVQCSLEDGLRSLQIIHGAYLSNWKQGEISLPAEEDEFQRFLTQQMT